MKQIIFILLLIAGVLLAAALPAQDKYIVVIPNTKVSGVARYNDTITYDPISNQVSSSIGYCVATKVLVSEWHGIKSYEIYTNSKNGEIIVATIIPKKKRWSRIYNSWAWSDTPEPIFLKPVTAKSK